MHVGYILDYCQTCAEIYWEKIFFLPVGEFGDAEERSSQECEMKEMNQS